MNNWNHVRYFKPQEFDDPRVPGSGHRIDGQLLLMLDKLRHESGWGIAIHGRQGGGVDANGTHGHAERSLHRLDMGAKAADWHFVCDAQVRLQIRTVMQCGFGGTGIYFDWGVPVGFHTDVRPHDQYQVWTRENGNYIYLIKGWTKRSLP